VFYDKTVLESGLTVISETIPTVRSVAVGVWAAAGGRDELPEESGISHFLEHMMFKGTESRSAQDISEGFDRLGAEVNAFTSEEFTYYYARAVDHHAADAFGILADMVVNSRFDEKAAISEREVVLEEISRIEDTPDHKVDEIFSEALLEGHPLGQSVAGRTETVSKFTPAHLRSYTSRHYRSGDIVVSAAGNIAHADVVAMATRGLAGLPVAPRAERKLWEPKAERRVTVATKDLEQAHICWGTLALPADHDDRFAMDILNSVFGGSMASRLFIEIREKRGLVYAVQSYVGTHLDTGTLTVYAGTRPENAEQVIELIQAEAANLLAGGITDDELTRAKDAVEGALVLALENTAVRMTRLGRAETRGTKILSVDEVLERYNAVTHDDIRRVAETVFGRPKTLAVVGPLSVSDLEPLLH